MHDSGDYRCLLIGAKRLNTLNSYVLLPARPPDSPEIGGIDFDRWRTGHSELTANNGYPAPLIHWYIASNNVTKYSSLRTTTNENGRINAQSTLVFTPSRYDHGKHLICQVLQPTAPSLKSQNDTMVLNVLYCPIIVNISVRRLQDDKQFGQIEFRCTSDANPPVFNFSWLQNDTILENNTKTHTYPGDAGASGIQSGTISTSRLVIYDVQSSQSGKYECKVTTDLGTASASLIYSIIPDPPSGFVVDQNQTTSSTLFVAWQPGFDGGLSQTFSLEYCLNDTQGHGDGCKNVTNLTVITYNLTGLKPFRWYRLTLWAVNAAGNSSTVKEEASTAPLPPESYGINITLDTKKQILAFSEANQSFTDLCLIIRHAQPGESCASVNASECIKPDSNVSFQSENDPVVVTYGRGLCSEPAKRIIDYIAGRQSDEGKGQHFMTIVVGVTASAGVILLVSLGLMHFYGLLCCMKRKKENGGNNLPEGQMVDDDGLVYTSVTHDHPHPPSAPPIQTEDATLYASLNNDAMERRKGETKYSDTMAKTPDGQLMYGNYLVKKRKEEQARMPLPVQTDDVSPYANCRMDCLEVDMKHGGKGPVAPDGQPMYGNYLVKMRKQQKATEIAGTPDVLEMYGI